jgi:sugar phosphate isomerase/epimerase
VNRRVFLAGAAAVALRAAENRPKLRLSIFSKHLQWASYPEMASFAAEAGFGGVDITVRSGGHVLPERVKDDLPRAVEIVRSAGLQVPMITAGIVDTSSPYAEDILKTAPALGIRYYRWGGFKYSDEQPIPAQLEALKTRVRALAQMNEHYRIAAMYHTHSGMEVGAPIWDLWEILRGVDPRWTGINYDVAHATVEGGLGGWIRSFELTRPFVRGVALKDFVWARDARGNWTPDWVPAGQGMVNFPKFFAMLRRSEFDGPVQVHFEYEGIGGANEGSRTLGIPKAELLGKFRKDLDFYRERMRDAGLI